MGHAFVIYRIADHYVCLDLAYATVLGHCAIEPRFLLSCGYGFPWIRFRDLTRTPICPLVDLSRFGRHVFVTQRPLLPV